MRILVLLSTALIAAATSLSAQVPVHLAIGDIVLDAKWIEVRVMPETGFVTTPYAATVGHNRMLWDPQNPDSFLVSGGGSAIGGGFVQRLEFIGGGQIQYTPIAGLGPFSRPVQIGFDQSGDDLIVFDGSNVYRVDLSTGTTAAVTAGSQLWGTIGGGAMDPLTGDIYVGNNLGEIWRRASNGTVSLFKTGLQSGSSSGLAGLKIDSISGPQHYLYYAMAGSIRRIDLNDPNNTEELFFGPGFPSGQNITIKAFTFDSHGDIKIRSTGHQVWHLDNTPVIPMGGAVLSYLGQAGFAPVASTGDIAVVGGTPSTPFRLDMEALPGGVASFDIQNVPQPAGFGWLLASTSTFLPAGTGPLFGLLPDSLTFAILALPPVPGGIAFTNVPPASFTVSAPVMAPFIGQTWDAVLVAFSPSGNYLGRSNVSRETWQ